MEVLEYLSNVKDDNSFIEFVKALVEDRRKAEVMEKENAELYIYEGALGWKNCDIVNYLDGAVSWFEESGDDSTVTHWQKFAEFLYSGKVHE